MRLIPLGMSLAIVLRCEFEYELVAKAIFDKPAR